MKLSESVEMYLVTILRAREGGRAVPLSRLADTLSVSPASVNEMCRKLQDEGLVSYEPYRGVTLTSEGEQRASYVLRCHRLWEVFLVEKLGFDYDEAHEIACQLEHATSELLADRLDLFLDFPAANPVGDPIPRPGARQPIQPTITTLAALPAGQQGRVIYGENEGATQAFLKERGIRPGAWLNVIAAAEDSMLLRIDQKYLSLAQDQANEIRVQVVGPGRDPAGVSRSARDRLASAHSEKPSNPS